VTERLLTRIIAGVGLVGLAIAAYLTYVHYADVSPACTTGGCEKVQASSYAKLGGVPVALLGLIGYVGILASLAVRGETGRAITAGIALVGFGYSAYLTYLELERIDAICQWCVGSAVCMTALAVASTLRFLSAAPSAPLPSAHHD
jgi:uncharacterized membrane protein